MTDSQLNEAVAKKIWTLSKGGWRRNYSYGYDWRKELPIDDYCNDISKAWGLVHIMGQASHTDFNAQICYALGDSPSDGFHLITVTPRVICKAFLKTTSTK